MFKDVDTSESEDEKRVVKSEKDKRFGAMRDTIKKIYDKIKINDFVAIYNEFMELNKLLEKSKKIIEKEGLPRFYIRICFMLENLTNNLSAEEKKKFSASNNKSFNILKQQIKKNNKNYTKEIEDFKKNPIDSDEDRNKGNQKKTKDDSDNENKKKEDKDDSDSDSFDEKFKNDDDSDDESEEESDREETNPEVRRLKWLKKKDDIEEDDEEKDKEKDKEKEKELERKRIQMEKGLKRKEEEKKKKEEGGTQKIEEKKIEYTSDLIIKKLKEIVENRAKKTSNLKPYVDNLQEILSWTRLGKQRLEILLILMPVRYDLGKIVSQNFMPREYWLETLENIKEFLKILKTKDFKISEISTFVKDGEAFYKETFIYDALSTQLESLNNELFKSFKNGDYSSIEYVERLNDFSKFMKLAKEVMDFYEELNDITNGTKVAFIRLENLYYLHDNTLKSLKEAAILKNIEIKDQYYETEESKDLINKLATMIYRYSEDKNKIKAILYQTYHHCIHNRYLLARDYLLMSHITDHVTNYEIENQVLYNKVIVQMGLAAFRLGYINEAHQCLQEIVSSTKIKELLSQGISSKNAAVEKEEKRRLLPYHLHINIEYIESVYLICAMLLEVPNIAQDVNDPNKKIISKYFRKLFENYDRSYFIGPPETYRDHIYAASKELHKGSWKKSYEFLIGLNFWGKIYDSDQVKARLLQKIKENSFKCYLYTFKNCFESLSLARLSEIMELDSSIIRSLICKMISSKEISASLNENNESIIFDSEETTGLQNISASLIEKINTTILYNEKILDGKFGNYGFTEKEIPLAQNKNKNNKAKKTSSLINQNKKTKNFKSKRY